MIRRLVLLRRSLPLLVEVALALTDAAFDAQKARQRLQRKAREGDLDESIARIRALTQRQ